MHAPAQPAQPAHALPTAAATIAAAQPVQPEQQPAQPVLADPTSLAPVTIVTDGATPSGERSAAPAHVSLIVRRPDLNVLVDHTSTIAGKLESGPSGWTVFLQTLGARGWRTLASTHTSGDGRFRLRYIPRRAGSELARLLARQGTFGRGADAQSVAAAQSVTALGARHLLGRLNVYRPAEASWYGGGGSLACGGELTSTTIGVANKTLPCGTRLTLRYDGRSLRVRVIDRGPYVAGREFDLTEATKEALGFGGTGEVWSTR